MQHLQITQTVQNQLNNLHVVVKNVIAKIANAHVMMAIAKIAKFIADGLRVTFSAHAVNTM